VFHFPFAIMTGSPQNIILRGASNPEGVSH
jgi:hypothetical protein